jgi:hypothetical protein
VNIKGVIYFDGSGFLIAEILMFIVWNHCTHSAVDMLGMFVVVLSSEGLLD